MAQAAESGFDARQRHDVEAAAQFGIRRRPVEGILPTGSVTLDLALGAGGLPRGRMIELYGPPAIGKTTIGMQVAAAVQRRGDTVALVDAEHAFDPAYASRIGVAVDTLLLMQAEDGDQAFRMMEKLAASKAVDLIVVDSVAALLPLDEREAAIGMASPFSQSEMLANGLRRLARVLTASPACILFLNQVRAYRGFGYEETSSGGWSLKMHATVRAKLEEARPLGAGRRLQIRVVKNQLAPPVQMEFDFEAGGGVDTVSELIDRGVEFGAIRETPSGLVCDGEILGRSRSGAMERLRRDPPLAGEIRALVRAAAGMAQPKPVRRETLGQAAERAVNE